VGFLPNEVLSLILGVQPILPWSVCVRVGLSALLNHFASEPAQINLLLIIALHI